jgi:Calx-beta domain
VHFCTQDGTAQAGKDYAATSGVLEFPSGSSSAEFEVVVYQLDQMERNEQFTVELHDPKPRDVVILGCAQVVELSCQLCKQVLEL